MKRTKKTIQLICELERIIGDECYNPNSYNSWTQEYGSEFRYPVHYSDKNDEERITRGTIQPDSNVDIDSMNYHFGSNRLYIGMAIENVLNHLEDKFGLDFNELVKKRKVNDL